MNETAILKVKERLKSEAARKFPDDKERQNRYIWGTINRLKRQS